MTSPARIWHPDSSPLLTTVAPSAMKNPPPSSALRRSSRSVRSKKSARRASAGSSTSVINWRHHRSRTGSLAPSPSSAQGRGCGRRCNMARKWCAVILISVGVLLTLDVTGTIAAGDLLERWWPLILVTLGIAQLLDHPEHFVTPTILMLAGGVFLLSTLEVWNVDVGELIGPVILIGVGASILIGRTISPPLASRAETRDLLD